MLWITRESPQHGVIGQPAINSTIPVKPGDVVVIRAFDEVPAHTFLVQSVEEGCITGVARSGPLCGSYGEPSLEMIEPLVS
jgi:hypothetical protein